MTWHEQWASPDRGPEKPTPPALADLVDTVTSTRGWQARLRGARVHSAWVQIAGEELARHVTPVRLAGGVLVVRAESPAWATQVSFLAGQLLQRANDVLGPGEVRTVTVQSAAANDRRRQ